MYLKANLGIAIFVMASVPTTLADSAAGQAVEVTPISRYVTEHSRLYSYDAFKESIAKGTAAYNDTFRHPYLPLGGVLVDCQKTNRVGVTLLLTFNDFHSTRVGHRYRTSQVKDTTIKYIWSHSEHSKKGGRYFTRYRMHPHHRTKLYSGGITLRDVDRVDGILSVEVFLNSEPVYNTSFELVGCKEA